MKPGIRPKPLIFIGILAILNLVFPPPAVPPRYEIAPGEVALHDVIAPYDFFIPKTEEELRDEREGISRRIPKVFTLDNNARATVSSRIGDLEVMIDSLRGRNMSVDSTVYLVQRQYALSSEVIAYVLRNNKRVFDLLRDDLGQLLAVGIMDRKFEDNRIVSIQSGKKETLESIDRLYSMAEAESIASVNKRNEYRDLLHFFMTANIKYDNAKTEERIADVFVNVPKTKGKVLKGEIIAEKHKRVDSTTVEKIFALESTYRSVGTWEIVKTLLFRNILYLAYIFLLMKFNALTKGGILEKRRLYFVALMTASFMLIGRLMHAMDIVYVTPIAFFIFMFALYFNFHTALLFTFVFASALGILLESLGIFAFLFISGLVAAFSSQTIDSRLAFYRPLTYLSIANVGAILFVDIYLNDGGFNIVHLGVGVANSILVTISFVLFLPLFERIFGFTTDLTLLELGNLNLPIFKEMAIDAPGTYHHSIVVGNLAEAGARYIGADPVLARVGAYYHDIGKLRKPEYYIENQIGIRNPHDTLRPQMSALIIISHVKDGMETARSMRLPQRIIDVIEQHHGTTLIELFYKKALEVSKETAQDSFRYPGPRPKTKETALVMLADSVEAAARGERNITAVKLQKIVKDSIDRKFNDGQLDDCAITRHDLEQIKTAFLPILTGVFHPRVDYEQANKQLGLAEDRKRK